MLTDLTTAVRYLIRSPIHVLVVTLSLGIGMAVSVAVFSVIDALIFADIPGIVDRADLLRVRWGSDQPISLEDFENLDQRRRGAFATWAADRMQPVAVVLPTGAVTLTGAFVSSTYFETLGTVAVRGRLLAADDARAEASPVVLISERLWRDSYQAGDDVLGSVVMVSGRPFTIVGVTPGGFPGLLQRDVGQSTRGYPEIWLPLRAATASSRDRTAQWRSVVARLRPGATLAQAQAELAVATTQLNGPGRSTPDSRRLTTFRAGLSWRERPFDTLLTLGVFLFVPLSVLLIGCANAINLQLARATERSRELGVRIALGASRYRLARMLGVEIFFIAALSSVVGWYGAVLFVDRATPFIQLPVHVNLTSALFMLALIVTVVVVAGFAPAWLATRTAVAVGLKDVPDGSVQHKRLRAALVAVQVAISLSLLLISARGVRTLYVWLPTLPPSADHAIVAEFNIAAAHPGQRDSRAFVDAVLARLEGSAQTPASGFADFVRMEGSVRYWRPTDADDFRRLTAGGFVTSGWFDAYGAPLTAGRVFNSAARGEVVINDALASTFAGGAVAALGQPLRVSHPPGAPPRNVEVVGIVADRLTQIDGRGMPAIYVPMPESSPPGIVLVTRAPDVAAATTAIKGAVRDADAAVPWFSLETLEARALAPVHGLRDTAWFGAGLGMVALLLAATGLHAMLTYMIRRRTHEIGIRMAIGADTRAIVWLVVRQAAGLLLGGVVGAVMISAPLIFVLRVLPNLSPLDPIAILVPFALLVAVGLLASTVPAYRAATVDPIDVLRGRDA